MAKIAKQKEQAEPNIPWTLRGTGRPVTQEDIPSWAIGYVYIVVDHVTGMIYVGKKQLHSTTRSKIGIREKVATKTRKTFKKTTKDSGWMYYNTSCKPLQEKLKTASAREYSKQIIEWAYSKKNLSWLELYHQVTLGVLRVPSYNSCVAGHYWKQDIDMDTWIANKKPKITEE